MNEDGQELIFAVGELFSIANTLDDIPNTPDDIPSEKVRSTAEELRRNANRILDLSAAVIKNASETQLSEATDQELLDELKRRLSSYKGSQG